MLNHLEKDLGAKDVRLCVLFNKPDRRKKEIHIDYEGFVIPDEFIVGYGLDYDEKNRNLPFVGVLKPCVYENKDWPIWKEACYEKVFWGFQSVY